MDSVQDVVSGTTCIELFCEFRGFCSDFVIADLLVSVTGDPVPGSLEVKLMSGVTNGELLTVVQLHVVVTRGGFAMISELDRVRGVCSGIVGRGGKPSDLVKFPMTVGRSPSLLRIELDGDGEELLSVLVLSPVRLSRPVGQWLLEPWLFLDPVNWISPLPVYSDVLCGVGIRSLVNALVEVTELVSRKVE